MTETAHQECNFVTLTRAARIVAPIADQHQQDYFEGGIFLILSMLAGSPIAAQASKLLPELPELKRLDSVPLTQRWFAQIIDGPWGSTFDAMKPEFRWPAHTFLAWARDGLMVSHDDVMRYLRPPFSPGQEPVAHCNAAGAWWSFPQVLAWAATRDSAEVARIGNAGHFGQPGEPECVPDGLTVDASDRGSRLGAPSRGKSMLPDTMLQSDDGRRKLVGWLAMVTSLYHCRCRANSNAEREKWESCSCLGNAYDEVRSFGPIARYPIPKYQPEPEYGSFSLEWSGEVSHSGAFRSDVLNRWPDAEGPIATAAGERECEQWLATAMAADLSGRKKKAEFLADAIAKFGTRITKTGFNLRIWPMVAPRFGRDKPGAPRKSRGPIDWPV